jgi:hypothetical protein
VSASAGDAWRVASDPAALARSSEDLGALAQVLRSASQAAADARTAAAEVSPAMALELDEWAARLATLATEVGEVDRCIRAAL